MISSLPRLLLLLLTTSAATLLTSCGSVSPSAQSNSTKTNPALTWPQPAAITAGTPLGATQLDATANVAGTFVYSPAAGTVPAAGTQLLTATFTPADTADYATATVSQTLVVNSGIKQAPGIGWSQPAPMTVGTPLGPDQLNAFVGTPGTFVYTPAAGTVLPQGTQTLSVTFAPTDTVDYSTATASVPIVVNGANNPGGLGSTCGPGSANGGTYLYVSTGAHQAGSNEMEGFSVAADGSLASIPESPFITPGFFALHTIGTGSTLFGVDGYWLYSLAIHPDGCLSLENSTVAGQGASSNPSLAPMNLYLDSQQANLYSYIYDVSVQSYFASYSFDSSTGLVAQTGATQDSQLADSGMLAFDPRDRYAVTSSCAIRSGPLVGQFQRASNGALTYLADGPLPAAPQGTGYCPEGAAADHANHFVIAMSPCTGDQFCSGPIQLAVYTIDSSGNLTTSSTWQNMPTTVAEPGPYGFSPDDKYFAIAGYVGLDVFAWDSAGATLTHIATINNPQGTCSPDANGRESCTGISFGNLAWDANDHLYTYLGNQLFVYAVTSSAVTPAPGSPYVVQNPQWVTIVNPSAPTQ
jgi:hypothetical protein